MNYLDKITIMDCLNYIVNDFVEFHGDRIIGEDSSVLCGIGYLDGIAVTIIGQKSGHSFEEDYSYNFSMTKPCGFRKIVRNMRLAEKFNRPIICFIDTIGASHDFEAENNGQTYAISELIDCFLKLKVPTVAVVLNQACSGGAIGLAIADKLAILGQATMSSISLGAAKIIVKEKDFEQSRIKNSAIQLLEIGVVDDIIYESFDEDNRLNIEFTSNTIKLYIINSLKNLIPQASLKRCAERKKKYLTLFEKT